MHYCPSQSQLKIVNICILLEAVEAPICNGVQGRKRFWTGGDTVDSYGKRQRSRGRGSQGGHQNERGTPWQGKFILNATAGALGTSKFPVIAYHYGLP